jgi:hypothetical protein
MNRGGISGSALSYRAGEKHPPSSNLIGFPSEKPAEVKEKALTNRLHLSNNTRD